VDRHGSFWGAQAASLLVSATCRNNLLRIKFRLREIVAANLSVTVRLVACAAHADFLRRPIDPVADVHCPRCRTLGGHKFAPQYRGSISHAALHLGGFLFSIFIQAAGNSAFVVVAGAKSYSIHIQCSLGVIVFYFCCLLRSL